MKRSFDSATSGGRGCRVTQTNFPIPRRSPSVLEDHQAIAETELNDSCTLSLCPSPTQTSSPRTLSNITACGMMPHVFHRFNTAGIANRNAYVCSGPVQRQALARSGKELLFFMQHHSMVEFGYLHAPHSDPAKMIALLIHSTKPLGCPGCSNVSGSVID